MQSCVCCSDKVNVRCETQHEPPHNVAQAIGLRITARSENGRPFSISYTWCSLRVEQQQQGQQRQQHSDNNNNNDNNDNNNTATTTTPTTTTPTTTTTTTKTIATTTTTLTKESALLVLSFLLVTIISVSLSFLVWKKYA